MGDTLNKSDLVLAYDVSRNVGVCAIYSRDL